MNSIFKPMRAKIEKSISGIRFKNLFLYLTLAIQVMTLFFGIVCGGAGGSREFEIRAKAYTRLNKTVGQTYSLVVPPNKSMSMNYLKDHIRGIERDPVMKKNCKLFYVNRVIDNVESIPFALNFNDEIFNSSIVYTVDTIEPAAYFDLDIICGSTISVNREIMLPIEMAIQLLKSSNSDSLSSLIGKAISNENDGREYTICGVFEDKNRFINHFVSPNYIIGSFIDFCGNNINHRLGFSTGINYLENLFFIFRMTYFIDPPNYNRQTIVSLSGNDFDMGGNLEITDKLYGIREPNNKTIFALMYYLLCVVLNAASVFFFSTKKINKKEIIFLSLAYFVLTCIFSGIGFLYDLFITTHLKLRMNMTSCTSIFAFSLITLIINFIVCSRSNETPQIERVEYHEISI